MSIFVRVSCALVLMSIAAHCEKPSLAESLFHLFMVDGPNNILKEPKDERVIYKEYDFIVVGAGTAGCVVANRLSENPEWKILLIEAGGEENFLMDVPLFVYFLQFSGANWKYKTEPSKEACLGMENNQCHWPRGKVMGGSSVLNYMIFTRGNKRDYDHWEALGNKGWGWQEVLPYFKKLENLKISQYAQNKQHHSTDGYLSVTLVPYKTPIADAFIEAGKSMGQPVVDFNAGTQTGFNYLQVTMHNGSRYSSSKAYLHTIRRPNLHVKKMSMVTKILIDPTTKTAIGVEFVNRKKKFVVKARKEVIVSGGTINSPQLLMLSGIGPKDHLREKKINVIQDLKVGYNLQDHTATGGLTYLIDHPYSIKSSRILQNPDNLINYFSFHKGPISTPGGCEALGFLDLNNMNDTDGYPDVELLLVSGSLTSDDTLRKAFNIREDLFHSYYKSIYGRDSFMILPLTMRPKSVGRIMLRDNNPFHYPLIYANYFSDPEGYDIRIAIDAIRKSNEIVKMPAFQKMGAKLHDVPLPPCKSMEFDTDAYWECYARHFTFTIYHHVGTCKMGPDSDPDAVVDERLRVRGIKNLRVIDASIMPFVPSGHTNAPTYMIAEKGSDMIKQDWSTKVNNNRKRKHISK